jgi:hypothetical protein
VLIHFLSFEEQITKKALKYKALFLVICSCKSQISDRFNSNIFLAFTGIFAGYWKIENQAIEG